MQHVLKDTIVVVLDLCALLSQHLLHLGIPLLQLGEGSLHVRLGPQDVHLRFQGGDLALLAGTLQVQIDVDFVELTRLLGKSGSHCVELTPVAIELAVTAAG